MRRLYDFGIFRAEVGRPKTLMWKFPAIAISKNLCAKVWQQHLLQLPAAGNFGKESICVSWRQCSHTALSQEQVLNNGETC